MSFVDQRENGKKYANEFQYIFTNAYKTLSMAKIVLLCYAENNLHYIL